MSPRSNRKASTWSAVNFKKHLTARSCKSEPAFWSHDTGQRIPCFDMCQLIITWMSNIKEVHSKPRLHVSVNPLFGVWLPFHYLGYGRHVAWLRRHRRRRAYAPSSNTASHDNHEKINSWVSFCFSYEYGAPLGGAPLIRYMCIVLYFSLFQTRTIEELKDRYYSCVTRLLKVNGTLAGCTKSHVFLPS